jgi:hypothetical protein
MHTNAHKCPEMHTKQSKTDINIMWAALDTRFICTLTVGRADP